MRVLSVFLKNTVYGGACLETGIFFLSASPDWISLNLFRPFIFPVAGRHEVLIYYFKAAANPSQQQRECRKRGMEKLHDVFKVITRAQDRNWVLWVAGGLI